jgi:flagellar hook-associated protein 1 FlgK
MEIARSNLSVLSDRTAVTSRNVANAGNQYATRKLANTVTAAGGIGVRLASITRASDDALFDKLITSNSSLGRHQVIVDSLDRLNQTINDVEQDFSPAAVVGKLADALQQFSAAPQDDIRAQIALSSASEAANALNAATDIVQQTRTSADQQIADSVASLNNLLGQFEEVNRNVINGSRTGADITDQLDTRDRLLADISREIGIRTVTRANNDVAIYTDSGVTMFETQPRVVAFEATLAYNATSTGNAILVDGVQVTGSAAPLPIASGRLKGLTEVRDEIAVTYQNQLDEIARGLISVFAESDQSAIPALPDATGLFSYTGSPAVPPPGAVVTGLAGQIRVNAAVDPAQGGDTDLLRDGGINGAAYLYNSSGGAGFSDRLLAMADQFFSPRAFDPTALAGSTTTLVNYASNSVGWLQEARQSANTEFEFRTAIYERSTDSLSKVTGVNLDYEMTVLLELERSYQATSRLIATINNMFDSLILAAG